MEGNELTVINQEVGIMIPPEETIEAASLAAKALKRVVSMKTKPVIMNGEQYLEYEDLQLLGQFYGYTAKTGDAVPVEIDGVKGAKAHADLINFRTGEIVGGAEAYCMRDEEKWNTRPKYEWQGEGDNRKRVKVSDEVVPWFQLASMAQTRAGAKAFRNRLAWVVVLAGYRPTPAEEMTESTVSPAVQKRRTVDKSEHYCAEHNINFFKSGKMRGYAHKIEGTNEWCNEPEKPAEKPDTRGEFAKAGRNLYEESIEKAQKHPRPPSEPPESATEPLDEETKADVQPGGFIDHGWLDESLKTLRAKKLTTWLPANLLSFMKTTYKVEADTVTAAAQLLDKGSAAHFTKKIQETLSML